jgi:RNA polymerase sigma-70 factor (ECF subfamily)
MAESGPIAGGGEPSRERDSTSLTLLLKLQHEQQDVRRDAWLRVYTLYDPLVRHWCRRWGVTSDSVEDVRQDVYCVVSQKLPSFRRERPGDTFRGWLRGITRYIILDHMRKSQAQPRAAGGTDAGEQLQAVPAPAADNEDDDPVEERAALVHRALELIWSRLDERERQVIQLTCVEQVDARVAAERLHMSHAAVRAAKSRALRRLREELGDC